MLHGGDSGDNSIKGSVAKQMIFVRADQLLNITVTKSGLELLQRLSTLFNDVYNKRLPPGDDDEDHPMISIVNRTGKEILVDHLQRIQVRSLLLWSEQLLIRMI